jgi:hypothetical protein
MVRRRPACDFKTGIIRNWPGINQKLFFKQQLPAIEQQLSAIILT